MYQLKTKLGAAMMLILLSVGCSRHSTQAESIMEQAKKCISEYPDSALHLLQRIPTPAALTGKEQANYALLYTQACDKNYIPYSTDSLIRFAVDYYGNGHDMNAALSYFYLGCACWNGGRNVDAVNAFLKALKAFPPGVTDRLFMQIHIYLGECCNEEGHYQDAKKYYSLAYQNAVCRKDTTDMYYPLRGLGAASLYLHHADSALSYFDKALRISRLVENADMEKGAWSSLVGCYELLHDYEKVNQYATKVIEAGDYDLTNMYRAKGNALLNMNQPDSAYHYLNLSLFATDLATRTMGYYSLYELLKKKDDIRLTEYVDSFIVYKDSLNLMERYKEVQELKEDYAERAREQENLQYRSELTLYSCIFCLIVGGGGIIVYQVVDKRRKQHYAELRQKLAESKIDNMKKCVQEEFGETTVLEIKLKELEEKEVKSCIRAFRQTVWHKRLAHVEEQWLSAKEQRELFKDLSLLFPGFIETLKEDYPEIKEQDIYFCILSAAGYKLKIVADCLQTTDRNLSTRKSRLKKVLGKRLFDFVFGRH